MIFADVCYPDPEGQNDTDPHHRLVYLSMVCCLMRRMCSQMFSMMNSGTQASTGDTSRSGYHKRKILCTCILDRKTI